MNPEYAEVDDIIEDVVKDCREKCFDTHDYRLMFDLKFTNMESNEVIKLTITHGYICSKSQFDGLYKKIKNAKMHKNMHLDLMKY